MHAQLNQSNQRGSGAVGKLNLPANNRVRNFRMARLRCVNTLNSADVTRATQFSMICTRPPSSTTDIGFKKVLGGSQGRLRDTPRFRTAENNVRHSWPLQRPRSQERWTTLETRAPNAAPQRYRWRFRFPISIMIADQLFWTILFFLQRDESTNPLESII